MVSNDEGNEIIKGNEILTEYLKKGKPFCVARLGYGPETYMMYDYLSNPHTFLQSLRSENPDLNVIYKICGIYSRKNDIEMFEHFWKATFMAIQNSDALASFTYDKRIRRIQTDLAHYVKIPQIAARSLEPFYICEEKVRPWTLQLYGKRVLIVSPFTQSFERQIQNKFRFFKDPNQKIFEQGQEFVFYKTYNTQAHNHIHENWIETFKHMAKDIAGLEFDVALLGCGGYGLPLCNFIKTRLNKSAIYIGGGLQLLFGVIGERWLARNDWKKRIFENDMRMIHPQEDEKIPDFKNVEGGAYW